MRTAATIIAVTAALYLAREILIPLAFAVTLALVLSPAVGWLQKLHIRRFAAVLAIILVLVAASGTLGYVIFNQFLQVVSDLPAYRENIDNKIKALQAPPKSALGRAAHSVQELGKELTAAQEAPEVPSTQTKAGRNSTLANPLPVQVVEAPPSELLYLRDLLRPFLAPLATLGIVLVFTVFLLVEETDLRNRLFRLAGVSRVNVMTQALQDATQRVSRYLLLQFLVNVGFGLIFGTGLFLIGVPYAALFGTLAALLRIVPYVGSVVAGLLPLVLSLAVFNTWGPRSTAQRREQPPRQCRQTAERTGYRALGRGKSGRGRRVFAGPRY
jgi:predicted PurR-regulated permease PerM